MKIYADTYTRKNATKNQILTLHGMQKEEIYATYDKNTKNLNCEDINGNKFSLDIDGNLIGGTV